MSCPEKTTEQAVGSERAEFVGSRETRLEYAVVESGYASEEADEPHGPDSAYSSSETPFRAYCDATSDCITVFAVRSSRRFVLEWLNPAGECAFSLCSADVVGKTLHEIWPPEIADPLMRSFQLAIESPRPTSMDLTCALPAGRRCFHGVLVPARYHGEPAHRLTAAWRDITQQKAFEQTLCEREEMFRRLVETTSVIPWEADFFTQRFTYVGPQAIKRFGYPAAEWYREGFWREHIHPDDRDQAARTCMFLTSASTSEYELEYRMLARDDEVVWVHDLINVVLDKTGRPMLRGFLVDVTARRQAEEEAGRLHNELEHRVAERTQQLGVANKELEAFCYSVSHDLRAPLRAIDGFSKALLEDCSDRLEEDDRDALRRVRAASQRMGELIDDLLMLSRVTRAEMRRAQVSLSEMARVIAADLHKQASQRNVEWVVQPELSASGDPALLRVVLENLLGNAWKYTSRRAAACIEFGWRPSAEAFFVHDNGAGFDPTYASKLFQPFQRMHRPDEFEGHGIGLATVQRIIHRHGGQVWAEGAVDQGATVYFTLP